MRIYTDGVFDLFHFGHSNVFKQIKIKYPDCYLMVGINSDEDTLKYKGPTVMTYDERVKNMEHVKYVDEIIHDVPWIISEEFLTKNNIDYIARESNPYVSKNTDGTIIDDIYSVPKKLGKFLPIVIYTNEISTSKLIGRILSNYELYNERNKSRGF